MLAEETEEPMSSCLQCHGVDRVCGSALRVRAGHEPLTTLPWGLVKAVGREKRGTGREKGEGDGRRGEVEKESCPQAVLATYTSPFEHADS